MTKGVHVHAYDTHFSSFNWVENSRSSIFKFSWIFTFFGWIDISVRILMARFLFFMRTKGVEKLSEMLMDHIRFGWGRLLFPFNHNLLSLILTTCLILRSTREKDVAVENGNGTRKMLVDFLDHEKFFFFSLRAPVNGLELTPNRGMIFCN